MRRIAQDDGFSLMPGENCQRMTEHLQSSLAKEPSTVIRGIKGIKDITPDQMPKWSVVERNAHALAHVFWFS